MHNQTAWSKNILRWGQVLAILGVVMALGGVILGSLNGVSFLVAKFLAATGLVLLALGLVSLGQYAFVRRNPKAGREILLNERDERMQLIRTIAGNRAFWVSSGLAYALLMWASFAGDAGLPELTADNLWVALVVVVVVPFIFYIATLIYEQSHR